MGQVINQDTNCINPELMIINIDYLTIEHLTNLLARLYCCFVLSDQIYSVCMYTNLYKPVLEKLKSNNNNNFYLHKKMPETI